MILGDVADQLAAAAGAVGGLRVHPRPGPAIAPPALIVGLPELVEFDQTYGRGYDAVTLTLFVLTGRTSDRAAGGKLLDYLSGSGEVSIKAAIEAGDYTAFDEVRVVSAATGAISHDGVDYLGATFDLRIMGRGDT